MDDNATPKQQLVERLKGANNILVTVSTDPTVDQLAACIGLTLWLNKLGKHATAVFSGEVPNTLEFLQPETTLEKNTDSLRDFIISLDKSKADKLRYKVEDRVVKIFITPYRTSLSADDLEFSQGDFNVDVVVALGVKEQQDLDNAIVSHGRILHDASVISVNTAPDGGLGGVNWHDPSASSLCELVVDLGRELGKDQLDGQIATALLTGVVAETERFSNEKTTPQTMSVSAELMAAGANQQLVASKLNGTTIPLDTASAGPNPSETSQAPDDGTLEIEHKHTKKAKKNPPATAETNPDMETEPQPMEEEPKAPEGQEAASHLVRTDKTSKLVTEPPTLGGTLTANSNPDRPEQEASSDPLSLPKVEEPILSHTDSPMAEDKGLVNVPPATPLGPPPPHWNPPSFADDVAPGPVEPPAGTIELSTPPTAPEPSPQPKPDSANETLSELEQTVASPHTQEQASPELDIAKLDSARSEVEDAINSVQDVAPAPVEALNAQPVDLAQPAPATTVFDPAAFGVVNDPDTTIQTPQPLIIPGAKEQPSATQMSTDPGLPPPVPPPFNPVVPPADQNDPAA